LVLVVKNLVPTVGGVKAAAQACPPNSKSDAPQQNDIKRTFMVRTLSKKEKIDINDCIFKYCFLIGAALNQ
jgi:hypothetical protein